MILKSLRLSRLLGNEEHGDFRTGLVSKCPVDGCPTNCTKVSIDKLAGGNWSSYVEMRYDHVYTHSRQVLDDNSDALGRLGFLPWSRFAG
jgi:hypothetical protein